MKTILFCLALGFSGCSGSMAVAQVRPDVCKYCFQDTTGGYTSIEDTVALNPICNYELLTKDHLTLTHKLKISRAKIPFFPNKIDSKYAGSGDSRGHAIPYEDLAYSKKTAKASMNLKRNLAPEPQAQNIGTELASENYQRLLADSLGFVKIWVGTWGTVGEVKGINKPSIYWKLIIEPNKEYHAYWMPTTGDKISYGSLKDCEITYTLLVKNLGFDPLEILPPK